MVRQTETGNPLVMYLGEIIEISPEEHHVLYLRGHLTPVYKHYDMVKPEPCFGLRRNHVLFQRQEGGENLEI